MTGTNRVNYYDISAMLAASCLAIFIPFELVLLSYAILGPAHYLTEIVWLKEKQFFTVKKYDYLFIAAIVPLGLLLKLPFSNLLFYTFGLSFIMLAAKDTMSRIAAFIVLIIAGYFLLTNNLLRTIFGLYLPTLIHVYVFTGAFILFGALKDRNVSAYLSFFVFLFCPLLLCFAFTNVHTIPTAWATRDYGFFTQLNTTTMRSRHVNVFTSSASIILTRLFAFAYTYHYINWFSKTRVISWHRINVTAGVVIGLLWLASVGLYFYNYRVGVRWLFVLSLAHVILEFPLNHRSMVGIGRQLSGKLMKIN